MYPSMGLCLLNGYPLTPLDLKTYFHKQASALVIVFRNSFAFGCSDLL